MEGDNGMGGGEKEERVGDSAENSVELEEAMEQVRLG